MVLPCLSVSQYVDPILNMAADRSKYWCNVVLVSVRVSYQLIPSGLLSDRIFI